MNEGFGWSFYGFFVVAGAWCAAYFAWATWKNARDAAGEAARDEGRERGVGEEGPGERSAGP